MSIQTKATLRSDEYKRNLRGLVGTVKKAFSDQTKAAEHSATRTRRASQGMAQQAEKDSTRMQRAQQRIGQSAKRWLLGVYATAVLAVSAALRKATADTLAFEKGMAEVSTLIDENAVSMDALADRLRKIAQRAPVSLNELTAALYQTVSAGVDANDAIGLIEVAARAAVGGNTDLRTAVDGLTSALNGFGLQTTDAASTADSFFVAVKRGKTTFSELSADIGRVAADASSLGVSLDDVLAAVAALTLTGLSTSEAITQVASVFTAARRNGDRFAEVGVDITKSLGERGLLSTLRDVRAGADRAEVELVELFGRVEGAKATLSLTGAQADDFASILDEMGRKAGSADRAFGKMNDTLGALATRLKNRVMSQLMELAEKVLPKVEATMGRVLRLFDLNRSANENLLDILQRSGAAPEVVAKVQLAVDRATLAKRRSEIERELSEARVQVGVEVQRRGAMNKLWETLKAAWEDIESITDPAILTLIEGAENDFETLGEALDPVATSMKELEDRADAARRRLVALAQTDFRKVPEDTRNALTLALTDELGALTKIIALRREQLALEATLAGTGSKPGVSTPPSPSPGPDPDEVPRGIFARIEALKAEQRALVETGKQTQRLIEVNRELAALEKLASDLAEMGLTEANTALRQRLANEAALIGVEGQRLEKLQRAQQLEADIKALREQATQLSGDKDAFEALSLLIKAKERQANAYRKEAAELEQLEQIFSGLSEEMKTTLTQSDAINEAFRRIADSGLLASLEGDLQAFAESGATIVADLAREVQSIKLNLDPSATEEEKQAAAKAVQELVSAAEKQLYDEMQRLLIALKAVAAPAPFVSLIESIYDALGAKIAATANQVESANERAADSTSGLVKQLRDAVQTLDGLRRLGNIFGSLSKGADEFIGGLLDALDAATMLVSVLEKQGGGKLQGTLGGLFQGDLQSLLGQLPGVIGVVGGIASAISGLIAAGERRAAEEARRMQELRDAIHQNADRFDRAIDRLIEAARIGENVSGTQAATFQQLFGEFLDLTNTEGLNGNELEIRFFEIIDKLREISELGIEELEGVDLGKLFHDLVFSGKTWEEALQAILTGEGIEGLDLGLGDIAENFQSSFGGFSNTVDGAIARMEFFAQFMGVDAQQAIQGFLDYLLGVGEFEGVQGMSPELSALLSEFATADAQRRGEIISEIAGQATGPDAADFLGELTVAQVEALLAALQGQMPGGTSGSSSSTGVSRAITEAQAGRVTDQLSGILAIETQQLTALRAILFALTGPVSGGGAGGVDSGRPTPSAFDGGLGALTAQYAPFALSASPSASNFRIRAEARVTVDGGGLSAEAKREIVRETMIAIEREVNAL